MCSSSRSTIIVICLLDFELQRLYCNFENKALLYLLHSSHPNKVHYYIVILKTDWQYTPCCPLMGLSVSPVISVGRGPHWPLTGEWCTGQAETMSQCQWWHCTLIHPVSWDMTMVNQATVWLLQCSYKPPTSGHSVWTFIFTLELAQSGITLSSAWKWVRFQWVVVMVC